ncbi:MAG: phage major capsid protein [Epsilonproteobacteria bacterium]|nr:phage major capsid protein [Campylobacterota bacterium]
MRIQVLREKLGGLQKQMRGLLDEAGTQARELTTEEVAKYDAMEKDFDNTKATIEREEKLAKLQVELEAPTSTPSRASDATKPNEDEAKKAYRDAFFTGVARGFDRLGSEQVRVLQTGVSADGGYLVPTEFQTTVISALNDTVAMRRLGTVIRTSSTTKIPLAGAKPTFAYISENGAYPETDVKFGQVSLDAYKAGGTILASRELLNDAFIDVETYIRGLATAGLAELEEGSFVTGNGTAKPTGFTVTAGVGVTTAGTAAVTSDEILDLYYSVKAPYRAKSTFTFSDIACKAIRKLKDANGQYIWADGFGKAPDMILGRPVETLTKLGALATGSIFGAFGDFSYYEIADRGQMSMLRLNELYAGNGQVGFQVDTRNDGILTLSEAVKTIKNA